MRELQLTDAEALQYLCEQEETVEIRIDHLLQAQVNKALWGAWEWIDQMGNYFTGQELAQRFADMLFRAGVVEIRDVPEGAE